MSGDFVSTSDGMRLWWDSRLCLHSNFNACPTCDFDRYYASKYPNCQWRDDD